MKVEGQTSSDLPTSLILAASVIITVLVALFLALSDDLQTRLPVPIRPTALVQSDVEVVNTLPPASATPTPTTEATTPAGQTATPTTSAIIIVLSCNNRPSDWQAYLVGPNDTLSSLSIRYGATIEEIVLANCLETNAVLSGMTIYLPITFPIRERCGPPPGWRSYTVRRGETLFILARRHGTTVYAIKQANCMIDSRIFAGRELYLPLLSATVPPPLPTRVPPTKTPIPTLIGTPTATATSPPSPTPSATSAVTPSPTVTTAVTPGTPTATHTPSPSDTPGPSPTASPTAPPSPTTGATGTAVPTQTPTLPPDDTATPIPPTNTPAPTATNPPPPSATPAPSQTPES